MFDETNHSPREVSEAERGETGSLVAFPRSQTGSTDNLPLELSSFVGREREVAEAERLLADRRLLTLCGPGGCGKTRLALAVARELVEGFEDGVWWVDLASIAEPDIVPQAVAQAVGVREARDLSPTGTLVEHLKPREALLVLDNCEHLVEACADLADTLLRTSPELRILATSREPLRVAGETNFMVPSLSLPDPDLPSLAGELERYEAVRLFVERSRGVDSGFALTEQNASAVARLCEKLDGIPLAIELAAARTRVLTVEQISERLEDPLGLLTTGDRSTAPRHRTLRATLRWSYDLLSEAERALLGRMSVFTGGFTLQAAEEVCGGERIEEYKVLDLLSELVDKSLVVAEAGSEGVLRYGMLEPIRQYSLERLVEDGEAERTRRRHAEHYLALAEKAERGLMGADQGLWLGRLRTELGNLRGALAWSLEPEEDSRERAEELGLRLAGALWRFWQMEGLKEGRRWLETTLERDPGGFPEARARALNGLGFILLFQQDYERAITVLEESIALCEDRGDTFGAAIALGNLGYAALHGGYDERVHAFVKEAEALMQGDLNGDARAFLRSAAAGAALLEGDLDAAVSQLEESLALRRELGDPRAASMSLLSLGEAELNRGDLDRGAALLEEGARIARELVDRLVITYFVWELGKSSALRQEPVRAARLWGAAEALREQLGISLSQYDLAASGYERDLAAVRSTLDESTFEEAWAEGSAMSFEQAIDYALEEPAPPHEQQAEREPPSAPAMPCEGIPAEQPPPTLRTAGRAKGDAGSDRRHNLPVARTAFVGREREMAEVERALSATGLLTITGTGGCGKTRLAIEVARGLVEDYPDGVWMVELAPLTEGELVTNTVASVLGVREQPGRAYTEAVVEFLRNRRLLLLLDNCEHLIGDCARLVDTLLSSCENVRVLATSREPLGVTGEVNRVVPSLTVPQRERSPAPQGLGRYESVRLFVERARLRTADFGLTAENASAVADICRKLDGIPLAIELALARLGPLSVEQIAGRLEDSLGFLTRGERTRAPRHQTLRAALDWSHDLLSEPERDLFGKLSVFAGGWTLAAAEAVGDGGAVEARQVQDLLSALVEKSLVVAEAAPSEFGGLRYRMLEPVRQYALEHLEAGGGAEEIRRLHAAFYLGLADEVRPQLRAAPQVKWLETLERENGNLRAALSWAISAGELGMAAWLGYAIWTFWWIHNHQNEGRRWMEMILPKRDELPPWLQTRATVGAITMAYGQDDSEAVERYAEELMELSREAGRDVLAEAFAHGALGLLATARGDFDEARRHLEEDASLYREAGEDGMAAQTHIFFGTALLLEGDHEGARLRFEEGLSLGRSIGDRLSICIALYNLAQLALAEGDYTAASHRFAEGIAPSEELGDRSNMAYILEGLGIVAGARGETDRAARLLGASEALRSAIGLRGNTYYRPDRSLYGRIEARARSGLGEAAFEAALEEGRAMSPEQAIEYALVEPMVPLEEETQPLAVVTVVPREEDQPSSAESADLRIFALGQSRVERGERTLTSSDWTYTKPKELLFYLLAYPGGRTKEQIGLALWPEASPSRLRGSFHDAMHRLRQALGGKEWIVHQQGRYAFERSLDYYYDVERFEEHLSEARRLQVEAPERAIRHLQEATDLYRGDYLEGSVGSEWALELQGELRRSYQEGLLLLGRLLSARDLHAEAVDAHRKAIAHDRFLEEAHRGLMRGQAAMGERSLALRHYEELLTLLEDELGTSPAPETRALYEQLRRDEPEG